MLIAPPILQGLRDTIRARAQPIPAVQHLYTRAGQWLLDNTPSDATVGYFEIGFMGFASRRTFVDPVGLLNEGVTDHVAAGDFTWAYRRYKPDYLLINPVRWWDRIGRIREEPWFDTAYREVTRIEQPGYFDAPLLIFEKVDDSAIPRG